eukprot:TRINITY_DN14978_c0_g1_i1.p2 TRINITY_DN14978_c0_g1~~TRINITY_DN14978_c0_g1_i1.p2  ORF type:complete len:235 (-),score=89.84 TRINITY_DN14978_c0_g1_i1:197-901(-)
MHLNKEDCKGDKKRCDKIFFPCTALGLTAEKKADLEAKATAGLLQAAVRVHTSPEAEEERYRNLTKELKELGHKSMQELEDANVESMYGFTCHACSVSMPKKRIIPELLKDYLRTIESELQEFPSNDAICNALAESHCDLGQAIQALAPGHEANEEVGKVTKSGLQCPVACKGDSQVPDTLRKLINDQGKTQPDDLHICKILEKVDCNLDRAFIFVADGELISAEEAKEMEEDD